MTTELRLTADRISPADPATAGATVARLAADLFHRSRSAAGNIALSPYSIFAALAMVRAGALGRTAEQLTGVLGSESAGVVTAVDAAIEQVRTPETEWNEPLVAEAANGLWVQHGLQVRRDHLQALASGFGGGMFTVDFTGATAVRQINEWVSMRTRGLIPDLLQPGQVPADSLAVLVNALYLSAPWAQKFSARPDPLPFRTLAGEVLQAKKLGLLCRYPYLAGEGWQAINIPYLDPGLVMTILMPDPGEFGRVADALTPEQLLEIQRGTRIGPINLQLPAFSVSSGFELSELLVGMGVTDLFDERLADLTGVAGQRGDLVIGAVVHRAVVEIDENGTTAAAATAVVMRAGSAYDPHPPVPLDFVVDRPFLFLIADTATGAPLFLGQVTDPTG